MMTTADEAKDSSHWFTAVLPTLSLPTHQMRPCKAPETTNLAASETARISLDNSKPMTQCSQIEGFFYILFSTARARDIGKDVLGSNKG